MFFVSRVVCWVDLVDTLPLKFPARLYSCKATRSSPGILLMKDFSLYLTCDQAMHGNEFTFGPGELFGFNVGTTTVAKTDDLKGISDPD